jgi:hypothetical protein
MAPVLIRRNIQRTQPASRYREIAASWQIRFSVGKSTWILSISGYSRGGFLNRIQTFM